MAKNMRKLLVVSVIILSCASVFAQGDTTILTFQDAVRIALMNSVTLNQQKNILELNQVQKNSAIAQIGPNISLNGSATQFNGNSFNQQQGRAVNGIRDNISGSISANMNIFSGFGRLNTIRQNAKLVDAQAHFVNRTSQDVINTVATQYLQVLLDIELVRIAKENFDVLNKQYVQVQEFVRLGSKSPVDEYNQDALTKAAELGYVQAEITLNNDKALLTQTLLIDPFDNFKVAKPQWDVNKISNESLEAEKMLATAKQFRGDYHRAVENEKAQRYGAMATKSLMFPSLIAFGNYGSNYNFQHNVPDSATFSSTDYILVNNQLQKVVTSETVANPDTPRPFSEQFRTNNVYKSYGLQLTIPVFTGLQNRATYIQQRVAYRNSQLVTKNAEFQLKNDIQRSMYNFEGVKKAYVVSQAQLRAAQMALNLETERYNLGVTNFIDYSTANRAYVKALTDMAQAEYKLMFQKIQLDYALGTLKIEDLQ
jgi:outer membrane protein